MSKNKVLALFSVFLVFVLFVAMKPGDNPVMLMRVASIAAVVIFVGMVLYTKVLWKISPFNKLHKVVNIGGKWQGNLIDDGGTVFSVDAHIVQYLDDIKIKIKTDNFCNESLSCRMCSDFQGTKLYVVYKTKPNGKLDSKNQVEYGTLVIKCDEDYLEGIFYSSSKFSGKVELYGK